MGPRKRSKPNPQSGPERSLESRDAKPSAASQVDSVPPTSVVTKAGDLKNARRDSSGGRPEQAVWNCLLLISGVSFF